LYVVRINRHNKWNDSRPCFYCVDIMKEHGIQKLTYSTENHYETVKLSSYKANKGSEGYSYIESMT